jgi:hypothetical protein
MFWIVRATGTREHSAPEHDDRHAAQSRPNP